MELLPLKTIVSKLFYAQNVSNNLYGKRELRRQIALKAFERTNRTTRNAQRRNYGCRILDRLTTKKTVSRKNSFVGSRSEREDRKKKIDVENK